MQAIQNSIPKATLEVVAKNFFKEMMKYGFGPLDCLRFINLLLDLSFNTEQENSEAGELKMAA